MTISIEKIMKMTDNVLATFKLDPEFDEKYDALEKIEEFYEKFLEDNEDNYSITNFDKVINPLSTKATMNAIMMLDRFSPSGPIGGADHDVIFLGVDLNEMIANVDFNFLIDLYRSGVLASSEYDCLMMYV
jgi:hypothetical protein